MGLQRRREITLADIDAYVEHCLAHRTSPHVAELAQRLGRSPSSVSKAFQKQFGGKPSRVVKWRQMACAVALLTTTDLSIAEIARRCAYTRRESFSRAFKRVVGETPGEFRRAHRHH